LTLNSGTIKDAAGNAATLTLPTPGASGSLGANKALVVDGLDITVSSVSSTTADGTYGVGDVIAVTTTFSEAVTVTGVPQIELNTGGGSSTRSSLRFDGSDDYVSISDNDALDFSSGQDYSINFWFKTNFSGSLSSAQGLLAKAKNTNSGSMNGWQIFITPESDNPLLFVANQGNENGGSYLYGPKSSSYNDDKWHNVTIVYAQSEDKAYFYFDGSQYSTYANHGSFDLSNAGDFYFGTDRSKSSAFLDGYIDEVALWNDALTQAEVTELYNSGIGYAASNSGDYTSSTNLQGYWKMDEGTGTSVADASSNSNTGTISGATWSTDSPGVTKVNYASGTGGATLTFNYTVASGHTSSNLGYTNTSALALNGGTIKGAYGNAATLTLASPGASGSLGANKAFVVDGLIPTVSSVSSTTADGTYDVGDVIAVTTTFNESMTVTGTPQLELNTGGGSNNSLSFDGTDDYAETTAASSALFTAGASHTLELWYKTSTVHSDEAEIIGNYDRQSSGGGTTGTTSVLLAGSNDGSDAGKIKALGLTSTSTVNNGAWHHIASVYDRTGMKTYLFIDGAKQAEGTISTASDFGNSSNEFHVSGGMQRIIASTRYNAGIVNVVRVSDVARYTSAFTPAKSFTTDNNTKALWNMSEGTGTTVDDASSNNNDLTISGASWVTDGPGGGNTQVNYASGTGTATLTFNYTVASGHSSSDLDYSSTSALTLNSGTIKDAAGNAATLTLASPGEANSLGANKALVVEGNSTPVLADIANVTMNEDMKQNVIVSATDAEGDAITYTASSDTSAVVLTVSSDTLKLAPITDWNGTAIITVYASDGIVNDSKNFSLTVTNVNDAPIISDILGVRKSLSFDGLEDFVKNDSQNSSTSLDVSTTDLLTFSAWVNPRDVLGVPDQYSAPLLYTIVGGKYQYSLNLSENKLYFHAGDGDFEQGGGNIGSSALSINQWGHVCMTYDGSAVRFYINGVLDFEHNVTDTFVKGSFNEWQIGGNKFDGLLDEVAVWNSALSLSEITAIYNSGSGLDASSDAGDYNSSSNLQAYWKFNEGTGTTVADASGNSNTGIISGATWSQGGEIKTNEETEKSIVLSASDVDGDVLTYSASSDTSAVTTTVSTNTLKLTPALNYIGTSVITVIVSDNALTDTSKFDFKVINVNDAPVITAVANDTTSEGSDGKALKLSASDIDGDALTYSAFSDTTGLTVTVSNDTIRLKPVADYFGTSKVTAFANDGVINDSTTFSFTVLNVQDAPYAFDWVSTASDTIDISQSNLADIYELKWLESKDVDGETIDYLLYVKIGVNPPELIYDTTSTSIPITYQEFVENVFEPFPMLPRVTVQFSMKATDGIDTVEITGDNRVLFVNRYAYLSTVSDGIPTEFALHENYPNPFNPTTTLRFDLPELSDMTLIVYNMLGQRVKTFNMQSTPAGYHSITWDATNDLNQQVGAGVYLYQLQAKDFVKTRKMVLLK
jgi:hypothetical protein